MSFSIISTIANIFLIYIAVTTFEFGKDGGFVDYTGTAVVGQSTKKVFVFAVFLIEGAEFAKVFA